LNLFLSPHDQNYNIWFQEGKSQLMGGDIAEIEQQTVKSTHTLSSESYEFSSPTGSPQHSSGDEAAYSGIFKSVNDGIQGKFIKTNSVLIYFVRFIFISYP
jgi:hypothetical protein